VGARAERANRTSHGAMTSMHKIANGPVRAQQYAGRAAV